MQEAGTQVDPKVEEGKEKDRRCEMNDLDMVLGGKDGSPDPELLAQQRIPGLGGLGRPPSLKVTHDTVRYSVEPETPRHQRHRESTPAFEHRSPSPSPASNKGPQIDVEMTEAPAITRAHQNLPLPEATSSPDPISSPMHTVTAPETPIRPRSRSRSRSPAKAAAPSAPTPLKPAKRGGRRKSVVQGSKVEKPKPDRSRATSRKVTSAAKKLEQAAEKVGSKVKEAVAKIEAMAKEREGTPRRSARIRAKRDGTPEA